MTSLKRKRWGARGVLAVGLVASAAGNVLHAQPSGISRVISAWPVLALYLAIELISRVPVHRRRRAVARVLAAGLIAGIAAWVSYWHMVAVAAKYGETDASPYLLPLSVDGLVVVASICLVELGGRIRAVEESTEGAARDGQVGEQGAGTGPARREASGPGEDGLGVDGQGDPGDQARAEDDAAEVDNLTPPEPRKRAPRKPHPSAAERVIKAHQRTPHASHDAIAKRLNLSLATVKRHRPAEVAEAVNGREPELASTDA